MNTTFRIILLLVIYLIYFIVMLKTDKKIYKATFEKKHNSAEINILRKILKDHIDLIVTVIISIILLTVSFPNHIFLSIVKISSIVLVFAASCIIRLFLFYDVYIGLKHEVLLTVLLTIIISISLFSSTFADELGTTDEIVATSTVNVRPTVNVSELDEVDYEPSIGKISSDSKNYYFFYMKDEDNIILVKTEDNLEIKDNNSENTEVAIITEYICTTNTELKETSDNYQYYSTRTSYQLFLNDEQVVNVVEQ